MYIHTVIGMHVNTLYIYIYIYNAMHMHISTHVHVQVSMHGFINWNIKTHHT